MPRNTLSAYRMRGRVRKNTIKDVRTGGRDPDTRAKGDLEMNIRVQYNVTAHIDVEAKTIWEAKSLVRDMRLSPMVATQGEIEIIHAYPLKSGAKRRSRTPKGTK